MVENFEIICIGLLDYWVDKVILKIEINPRVIAFSSSSPSSSWPPPPWPAPTAPPPRPAPPPTRSPPTPPRSTPTTGRSRTTTPTTTLAREAIQWHKNLFGSIFGAFLPNFWSLFDAGSVQRCASDRAWRFCNVLFLDLRLLLRQ